MLAITMSATGQPCNGLSVAIDTLIISFQCAVVFGSLLANFLIYAAKTKQYGRNAFGLLAIAALSCVASYFLVLAHQQSCGLARGHWLQLF